VVIDHGPHRCPRASDRGFPSLLRAVGAAELGCCRAIASAATRLIPTRGHFTALVLANPNVWCGAGRIRALRARCPMPDICRIVSTVDAGPGDAAPHPRD
jgi:hypothetical protein